MEHKTFAYAHEATWPRAAKAFWMWLVKWSRTIVREPSKRAGERP